MIWRQDKEITLKIDDQNNSFHPPRIFSNTVPELMEHEGVNFIEMERLHEILFTLLGPQNADLQIRAW